MRPVRQGHPQEGLDPIHHPLRLNEEILGELDMKLILGEECHPSLQLLGVQPPGEVRVPLVGITSGKRLNEQGDLPRRGFVPLPAQGPPQTTTARIGGGTECA